MNAVMFISFMNISKSLNSDKNQTKVMLQRCECPSISHLIKFENISSNKQKIDLIYAHLDQMIDSPCALQTKTADFADEHNNFKLRLIYE